jgi:UPF0176 protein
MGFAALQHLSFYRFTPIDDPAAFSARLRDYAQGLEGSIVVAAEGVSGAVAAPEPALARFKGLLGAEPGFAGMAFKQSECRTRPYARLKVQVKPELVAIDLQGIRQTTGQSVAPQEWRELMQRNDLVLIDNRNSFEFRLGRFKGAIDPSLSRFSSLPEFIAANVEEWRGKTVAMYCTGGIRCEKSSALFAAHGIAALELQGGILNYFAALPDAEREFEGECFVFDNRIALDTRLQETETTAEQVYEAEPDGAFRIARARRLAEAVRRSES